MSARRATSIRWIRSAWERPVAWAAYTVFWGVYAGSMLTLAHGGALPGDGRAHILTGLIALVVGLAVGLLPLLRPRGRGEVAVTEGHLVLSRALRTFRIPRQRIVSGAVRRHNVDLRLADGAILDIEMRTDEEAEALVKELGLDVTAGRAIFPLGDPKQRYGQAAVAAFLHASASSIALAIATSGALDPARVTAWAILAVTTGFFFMRRSRFTEVQVGLDGIEIRTPFRTSRLGFSTLGAADRLPASSAPNPGSRIRAIREIGVPPSGVELVLDPGSIVLKAQVGGEGTGRIAALTRRIREAIAARKALITDAPVSQLERGDRTLAEWRDQVRALTRGQGYRSAAISEETLAAVVSDPSASAEARLGAALALGASADPDLRRRVRIAARACANPKLRIALTVAAQPSPTDEALEEALAEAERAATATKD